jgi:hypothetical protein
MNGCIFPPAPPFATKTREQATVGVLRATATDVDVSIRLRKEIGGPLTFCAIA